MYNSSYNNNSITFGYNILIKKLFLYYNKVSNKLLGKHIEGSDDFEYTLFEFIKNLLLIAGFIGWLYIYYKI